MATVGFIGIGTMGRDMALNLLAAGHRVRAWDVVAAAVDGLRAKGAEAVSGIADAA
ncbi:MAG: NAD(P)-binding domain-containing protein, partial [Alphaproteobacteria bacterium]|nr:NAD(P)-binding domain-containing protein [Alphaproteobacteria bacterium]